MHSVFAARPAARVTGEWRSLHGSGDPLAGLPLDCRLRDEATGKRLDSLNDGFRLFRCHTIMYKYLSKEPQSGCYRQDQGTVFQRL